PTVTPTFIPTSSISIGTPVAVPALAGNFIGLAASQDRLYATKASDSHIYALNADGNVAVFSTLPSVSGDDENYLAICPGFGGFPANHIFASEGNVIYDVAPDGSWTTFVTLPVAAVTHFGLVFDTVGSWGYDLLVSGGYTGGVFRVNSAGQFKQIAQLPGIIEGLDVAPAGFAPYGGYLFVPDESNGNVYAISPADDSVSVPVTWQEAEWVQFLWGSACSLSGTDECFFESQQPTGVFAFPTSAFAGLGNRAIVGSEGAAGIGLIQSDGTNLSVAALGGQNISLEGAAFVNCKIPAYVAPTSVTLTAPVYGISSGTSEGIYGSVNLAAGYTWSMNLREVNGATT
ncbi:MAG: hypothetical protein ACREKE_11130, partial [bacterium]